MNADDTKLFIYTDLLLSFVIPTIKIEANE